VVKGQRKVSQNILSGRAVMPFWLKSALFTFLLALLWLLLPQAAPIQAGIYEADTVVTYKEYWVPHSQFTGGHQTDAEGRVLPGCLDTNPGGTFYLEPVDNCVKTVTFTIPEALGRATRAELYFDLWRNRTPQYDSEGKLLKKASAIFQINDHPTWFETHPAGLDWSRTPLVAETVRTTDSNGDPLPGTVTPVLSLLRSGENKLSFKQSAALYHIHDIAVRIYFDPAQPLLGPNGQPIAVPNGALTTIQHDNGTVSATAGGNLTVNSDQLILSASLTTPASFVEFHGYYRGYDLDNNDRDGDRGALDTEWHNRGRNNWHPGGLEEEPLGGTVDHLGTVATSGPGTYAVTWNLPHVLSQEGVRFKIRIVNADQVVREAAGGVSAEFALVRSTATVALSQTNWQDFVLHHGGNRPQVVAAPVMLPCELVTTNYTRAYVLGSYWQNPWLSINGNPQIRAFVGGQDTWTLSVREIPPAHLLAGSNVFTYSYPGSGFGQFIEKPGPLLILRGSGPLPADSTPPEILQLEPPAGTTTMRPDDNIVVTVADSGRGVQMDSLKLFVNGVQVTPVISCSGSAYRLLYNPPASLPPGATVDVQIQACDQLGQCLAPEAGSYGLTVRQATYGVSLQRKGRGNLQLNPTKASYRAGDTITLAATPANNWDFQGWSLELTGWGDAQRRYRTSLTVMANGRPRTDAPVAIQLNFTGRLAEVGHAGSFDPASLRLVEVDTLGTVLGADLPLRFEPAAGYDAATNAAGLLSFPLQGSTPPDGFRFYQLYFDLTGGGFSAPPVYRPGTSTPPEPVSFVGATQSQALGAPVDTTPLTLKVSGPLVITGTFQPLVAFDLTTNINGQGTITKEPDFPAYAPGDIVTLTATAATGWRFAGWSGDLLSASSVITLEIDSDKNLTANFAAIPYTVTTTIIGAGAVQKEPDQESYLYGETVTLTAVAPSNWRFAGWSGDAAGATTPLTLTATFVELYTLAVATTGQGEVEIAPLREQYEQGESVTLTPMAAAGWGFAGWQGDLTGNAAPATIAMTANQVITAAFLPLYILEVVAAEGGVVEQTPAQSAYLAGEVVTLTAVPQPGWRFTGWGGDAAGAETILSVVMEQDKRVTAGFERIPYTLTVALVGEGTVDWTPNRSSYFQGEVITLTATAAAGWVFAGWSGNLSGSETPATLVIDGNTTITARFGIALTDLLTPSANGIVKLTPERSVYAVGEQVLLEAIPNPGWEFVEWVVQSSVNAAQERTTQNPLPITIAAGVSYEPRFQPGVQESRLYLPVIVQQ
jgi:hypothetical protein